MTSQERQLHLSWLKDQDPDEWHRVSLSWNWDGPYEILNWIVGQNNCDRATAQHLFWLGQPAEFLQFDGLASVSARASHQVDNFRLLKTITNRWQSGLYHRSELETSPDLEQDLHWMARDYAEEEANHAVEELPWRINEKMKTVLSGRSVDTRGYDAGRSPEFKRYVQRISNK